MSHTHTRTIARYIADRLRANGFDVLIPYNSDFSVNTINTGCHDLSYRVIVSNHEVIIWRILTAGGAETTREIWSRSLSDPAVFDGVLEFFNRRKNGHVW